MSFFSATLQLALEQHKYSDITRWTLSRDKTVFAVQVDDEMGSFVVYITSPHAPAIEQSVERYVHALVEGQEKKYPSARVRSNGEELLPSVVRVVPAPMASWHYREPPAAAVAEEEDEAPSELPLPEGWEAALDEDVCRNAIVSNGVTRPHLRAVGDLQDIYMCVCVCPLLSTGGPVLFP